MKRRPRHGVKKPQTIVRGVRIDRWTLGGDGLGYAPGGELEGIVIFVPHTVPGDIVDVTLVRRKRRWAKGEIHTIVTPSPHRVAPLCEHQHRCGGCPWMIGDSTIQRESREAVLRGELAKTLNWDEETISAHLTIVDETGPQSGYRQRVRLAFARERDALLLGYRAANSHTIVNIRECPVASPEIVAKLSEVRRAIGEWPHGAGEVHMVSDGSHVATEITSGDASLTLGPSEVHLQIGAATIPTSPRHFAQANLSVASAIAAQILRIGQEAGGTHAAELFAGSGTFTVPLLQAGYRVDAYELTAHAKAAFETATSGHGHARFHVADLTLTGRPEPPPTKPDLVLLDPPRTGASATIPWISQSGASHIIMVACDVATAMRDLAQLVARGYRCQGIWSFDMFPHTGHQELLIHLTK